MIWNKRREGLKLAAISIWLIFTVAFAIWWITFALQKISLLAALDPAQMEHWTRQKRMILYEGSAWIVLLVLGGGALVRLVQREQIRIHRIKEFFASFSHEVKTSLASLRVQAEALKEEHRDWNSPILERLIGDTVRLQLQLENSLFFSSHADLQFYIQQISLGQILDRTSEQWPGLIIQHKNACTLTVDERALKTIFSNLFQNSIVHGGASVVEVDVTPWDSSHVSISVLDNGRGFSGSREEIGKLFHRPLPSSGSGLGLFICRLLTEKMKGQMKLEPSPSGFLVRLILPGNIK